MIVLVTGTPGAGKTYYALRKIAEASDRGTPVITNVELAPDYARRIARRHWLRWLIPGRVRQVEARIARGTWVTKDADELRRVRVAGRGEDRGVVVLDEGAGFLNARSWSQGDRQAWCDWFAQHRKLGLTVYLIVQDAEMIDKQVRALVETEVRLRNLKRARMWGIPLAPFNLFLAIHRWAGGSSERLVMRRELYRLTWRKDLYDTFEVVHELGADEDAYFWLPRPPASPPNPPPDEAPQGADDPDAADGCESAAA